MTMYSYTNEQKKNMTTHLRDAIGEIEKDQSDKNKIRHHMQKFLLRHTGANYKQANKGE